MRRRRSSLVSSLIAAAVAGGSSGRNGMTPATGFLAAPRPSTSWGRRSNGCTVWRGPVMSRSCRPAWPSTGATSTRGRIRRREGGALRSDVVGFEGGVRDSCVRVSLATLRARGITGPTAAEMDDEWDAILAADDEEEDEEDEDGEDGEEEGEDNEGVAMMSDEELFATDATQGGKLDGPGEGEDGGGAKRVWYKSYKERARAEKQKEAEWQDKRSKFPAHHIAYLDEAQKNRDVAAARREKYTKKFFRKKKIYDIIKDRGRKAVREATWATRWPRNITRNLEDLQEGEWIEGKVRNVETYGAWVDVNAERDGLLHVRDMGETFTPSAGDLFSTKDTVRVRVKFVDPGTGKLGLSLVEEGVREGDLPLPPPRPQISVADVSAGAELWGYVERVTNMGAYVNVGAEVPGFLLLKEIPGRPKGLEAPQVLRRNKRLRVYAKEVDAEGLRIKLTCKRPRSRPRCGLVSALASDAGIEEFEYDDTLGRYSQEEEDEGEDDEWGEDDDEFDDDDEDDEGEWFYPERGEVIPSPEVDFAS